jgi:putative cardiolipin synthase
MRKLLLLLVLPWLTHCATAPSLHGVQPSYALPPPDGVVPEVAVMRDLEHAPGKSGVRLVEQNALAFAYRAATAVAAVRSIDVQYYIWHDDLTGRLLAAELMKAAERGVRVRVLVDDIDARAKHDLFRVADQHPNVEVRIFNPFYSRSGAAGLAAEWLTRADRLNHRMHNKAWIVDSRVAIVGGRNIGDEYFGASEHSNFSDLDVVLVGAVVEDVNRAFDQYWNDGNAVPVSRFDDGEEPPPDALPKLLEGARDYPLQASDEPYIAALRDESTRAELLDRQSPPLRVDAVTLLVDDPAKVGADATGLEASNVLSGLASVMSSASLELLIVSPYFVPRAEGARRLIATAQGGVRVAVATNSLAATDVAAVHTGYARQRRELLKGGVELYEMKRKAGSEEGRNQISVTGSSGASLHTKALAVDGRIVFVGSYNLDPRSTSLNSEQGIFVESPVITAQLEELFRIDSSGASAWAVTLHEGKLHWDDGTQTYDHAPDASAGRKFQAWIARVLPISSQL